MQLNFEIDLFTKDQCLANSLPNEIVGRWNSGTFLYEFSADGGFYFGLHGMAFSVSADGQQLDLDGGIYQRAEGSGQQIYGVWLNSNRGECLRFMDNGIFHVSQNNGQQYQGRFDVEGQTLTQFRRVAFVTARGGLLTFQPYDHPWEPAAFLLSGESLTMIFETKTETWQRVENEELNSRFGVDK